MTQALNYTPKAIADLLTQVDAHNEIDRRGLVYIIEKLRVSQVFMLPEYGQLLDRSTPRPTFPELMLTPPFTVTAVEYPAPPESGRTQGQWTAVASSRRIALAWKWQNDYPFAGMGLLPPDLGEGVAIASVCYLDQHRAWQIMPAMMFVPFDGAWMTAPAERTPFEQSAIDCGRLSAASLRSPRLGVRPLVLLPHATEMAMRVHGMEPTIQALSADVQDELNAYVDLCSALACRNVTTEVIPASQVLNRERRRSGKPPLFDTHVLKLGESAIAATGLRGRDRISPRQHLRRGHIRRLGPERLTWVNQTMVRGRGFADKVYAL